MDSGKPVTPQDISKYQWYFYVNGYMAPYNEEATWANDWLEGGITIIKDGHELSSPLNHLLIEELEDFKSWLIKVSEGTPISSRFDFIDADVSFELIETKGELILRLDRGYDWDNQHFLDTHLSQNQQFLTVQIDRIESLLELFPCRCGLKHTMFSKQHLS